MVWNLIFRLISRFDAERIHDFSVRILEFLSRFFPGVLRLISDDRSAKRRLKTREDMVRVAGIDFWGRIGLAAGFDKDGRLLNAISNMGFFFTEVGTVTPRAQPGNDKPRLFRLVDEKALFNRMGFNNHGCDALVTKLKAFNQKKPWYFRVGVNLGKNKDTPAEMAAMDYSLLAENLSEHADYLVINVSSPNTPGLRALQSLSTLETLVKQTAGAIKRSGYPRPLFVKLAPELEPDFVQELGNSLAAWGGAGLILTNTLGFEFQKLSGGLSGRPLKELSRESLRSLRKKSDIPVISVGGIDSPEEAKVRLDLGADLLQIYSSWIFEGPRFPAKLANYLHSK